MTLFNSPFSDFDDKFFGFYINKTNNLQIIRIRDINPLCWERVVFPGQRLIFEIVTEANLEIHTKEGETAILSEVIACQQLRVIEASTLKSTQVLAQSST